MNTFPPPLDPDSDTPPDPDDKKENPLREPKVLALLKRHFWFDFSDFIAAMSWDERSDAPDKTDKAHKPDKPEESG